MIRYSSLVGVSTDAQMDDKVSVPDQIKTCQEFMSHWNGVEIEHHVMDGYSRTGFDGLSDAMAVIPPLKEAVESASRGEFDVLVLDHFDRLGDLAKMLHTRLKRYKIQLISARESGRVLKPEEYDPWNDEHTDMLIQFQGIKQAYRLNKLRRGWNIGIPDRIKKGLVPFTFAYGYTRVDKKTPPVQNDKIQYVVMMKNWFLEGRAMLWICRQLDEIGAPRPSTKSKRWERQTVMQILINPFYAGIVSYGRHQLLPGLKGKSKGKMVYRGHTPRSAWKENKGGHVPLWDEDTYLAIQNEIERRRTLRNNAKTTYPLAGILRCVVCGCKLHRRNITIIKGKWIVGLSCPGPGRSHVTIEYDRAMHLLADALQQGLRNHRANTRSKEDEDAHLRAKLDELKEQRELIQDGYKAKIFSREEASQEMAEIERKELTAKSQLADLHRLQQTRTEIRALKAGMMELTDLYVMISEDDPTVINQILSTLCKKVTITPTHDIFIDFNED